MRILGEKNFLIPTPDGMQRVFLRGQMNFFGSPIDWFREIILIPFSGYFFPTNMRYQFLSFAQSAISRHVDANVQQPEAFNSCDLQCSCLQKSKLQTEKGCENREQSEEVADFSESASTCWLGWKKGFLWRTNVWNMFTIIFGNPAFDPKSDSFDGEKFVTVAEAKEDLPTLLLVLNGMWDTNNGKILSQQFINLIPAIAYLAQL